MPVVFFFAGSFSAIPFEVTLSLKGKRFLPKIVVIPYVVRRLRSIGSSYRNLSKLEFLESIRHITSK
jgi:hypothetical protein